MKKKFLIFILLFFFSSGCDHQGNKPYNWTYYIDFQNADIIYNSINLDGGDNQDILGYFSFKDNTITELDLKGGKSRAPTHPYYLDANTIMTANKLGNYGLINEGMTYLFIFSKAQFLPCDKLIGYGYPHEGNIVFMGNEGLSLINSTDCSIIKTLLDQNELSEFEGQPHIGTNNLSNNEDFIIMDIDLNLIKLYLPDKEIFDYHKIGTDSTLSPDQKKVTYLAPDGIHIMNIDGEKDKLIIPFDTSHGSFGHWEYSDISTPNWSSDSNKIVYHKCSLSERNQCNNIKDYSIFMYDLDTETETFLLKGGMNPSWGWGK